MDEIGDTIMPTTDTPGAKAAGIGAFMATMAIDCYDDESFASLHDTPSSAHRRSGAPTANRRTTSDS